MIDRAAIIQYAKERGVDLSPKILRGWSDKNIFPSADVHKGGQGIGDTAMYPDGSEKQAVAVYNLTRERDYDNAKWKLFEAGFPVEITSFLQNGLAIYKNFYERVQSPGFNESYIDRDDIHPDYPTFVYLLTMLYKEKESSLDDYKYLDWNIEDNKIFNRIINSILPGIGDIDIYSLADELRKYLEPDNLEEIFEMASIEQLRCAYREIALGCHVLWNIYKPVKWFWEGKTPASNKDGINNFDNLGKSWLLLIWLSLRNHPLLSWFVESTDEIYSEKEKP